MQDSYTGYEKYFNLSLDYLNILYDLLTHKTFKAFIYQVIRNQFGNRKLTVLF